MADILNFTGRRKERPPEAPFDYDVVYKKKGMKSYPALLVVVAVLGYCFAI